MKPLGLARCLPPRKPRRRTSRLAEFHPQAAAPPFPILWEKVGLNFAGCRENHLRHNLQPNRTTIDPVMADPPRIGISLKRTRCPHRSRWNRGRSAHPDSRLSDLLCHQPRDRRHRDSGALFLAQTASHPPGRHRRQTTLKSEVKARSISLRRRYRTTREEPRFRDGPVSGHDFSHA
jgi:hypothetical protein